MFQVFPFLLAFISGILVKLTDHFGDKGNPLAFLFAIFYGALIGYLISQSSFSMLFLGALFAQALANKIDQYPHILGFILALLIAFYLGLPSIEPLFFFLFLALAYVDEQTLSGIWKRLTEYRFFLKLGALAVALLFFRWDFFFGILIFDIGYLFIDWVSNTQNFKLKLS
jgi:hypothetical protein